MKIVWSLIFWFVVIVLLLIAFWCIWLGDYAVLYFDNFLIALLIALYSVGFAEVQQIATSSATDAPGIDISWMSFRLPHNHRVPTLTRHGNTDTKEVDRSPWSSSESV